jgi:hypothetical protein
LISLKRHECKRGTVWGWEPVEERRVKGEADGWGKNDLSTVNACKKKE